MNDFALPAHCEISHKFFTISVNLTARAASGDRVFEVRCPSLRLKKRADVYLAGPKPTMALWLAPVWGLTWNIQVNGPADEVLGVVQYQKNEETGKTECVFLDALGECKLRVRTGDDFLRRLKSRLTLFSKRRDEIYAGGTLVGTFVRRAGLVHERYSVDLVPDAAQRADPAALLATITTLTGVFNRLFT